MSNGRYEKSRIMLASSANSYANALENPISESSPLIPPMTLLCQKLAMKFVAKLFARQLAIVITRPVY